SSGRRICRVVHEGVLGGGGLHANGEELLRMSIFRRLGLALVAVAALSVWLASGATAESRQIPIGGTSSAQTGGFTPSGAGDVTQDEFPTGEASDDGPDPYGGTISFSTG